MGKDPLAECVGFEWDEWNSGKNWEKHRITPEEAEEVFFHDLFVLQSNSSHEKRYGALGHTARGRRLFLVFTVRAKHIRVISARDMSRKESGEYGRHEKRNS